MTDNQHRKEHDTTGILDRLFGTKPPPAPGREPHARPLADTFTCTTCGRSDLPEAGDWDPPICLECDAAINFDALEEEARLEDDGEGR